MPFVRSCQLCRKVVIPAYYSEAVKRGISIVVLGMNEWTSLSQLSSSPQKYTISGIRKLQPHPDSPAVYVVHLPFLLRRKKVDTWNILSKLDWNIPEGEDFVESNANSCLFACATEVRVSTLLGFSPDVTRLSREITAGFLSKEEAILALEKRHHYSKTVREVLKEAKIL